MHKQNSIIGRRILWRMATVVVMVAYKPTHAQTSVLIESNGKNQAAFSPLTAKEEMIRDRLDRLRDRIFDLQQKLARNEPENAARLARALKRSGEMGLAEQLEEIIEMLKDPGELASAVDQQNEWIEKADRLLDILLERDSSDRQRDERIDRLQAQRKQLSKLMKQQRGLRDASARSSVLQRLERQYEQFLRRIDALADRQTEAGKAAADLSNLGEDEKKALAERQEESSRMAGELSEDLKHASDSRPDSHADSADAQAAREAAGKAAKAAKNAADAMRESGQELEAGDPNAAQKANEQANEALRQARELIERALEELGERSSSRGQAGEQGEVAEDTRGLAENMRKGGKEGGGQGSQQSERSQQPTPGSENLDRAGDHMDDATQSLKEDNPEQATEQQESAVEKLRQTQQELEDELNQLRKEDRGEMLRDLEARFRFMLAKQRGINADTDILAELGRQDFARADRLRVAELAERQRSLGEKASGCVHILDEEGTTIVFPRVVGQLSTDMNAVATRLSELLVDPLTQAMQKELIETLEQLLESVKRMQQENEQPEGMPMDDDRNSPLLPASAELKLLRSSQHRINTRTQAIESMRQTGGEASDTLARDFRQVAERQTECEEIARQLHDRKNQP